MSARHAAARLIAQRKMWLAAGVALATVGLAAQAAEIPLYETGPGQDAAFVRFVNGGTGPLEVSAAGSKARSRLDLAAPASAFFSVNAGDKVKGAFLADSQRSEIALSVKPGEFATVVALPGAGAIKQTVLREQPDDFNALKASLALYNLDPKCTSASLGVVGRSAMLFEAVPSGALQRRALNPVSLSVQLLCGGKPAATPLALGALQAGQRYSVFVMPAAAAPRLFIANDSVAR